MDWRAALSPRVGHIGPNLVTILVCLFLSFIAYLYCFDYACGVVLHLDLGLFLLLLLEDNLSIDYHFLCSTHLCYSLVWFCLNSQHLEKSKSFEVQQDISQECKFVEVKKLMLRREELNTKAVVSLVKTWGTSSFRWKKCWSWQLALFQLFYNV